MTGNHPDWIIAADAFALFVFARRTNVRKLTMREAADEANVSPSVFARAENKAVISAANFLALCLWMKANPFWFLVDPKTGNRIADPPAAPTTAERA